MERRGPPGAGPWTFLDERQRDLLAQALDEVYDALHAGEFARAEGALVRAEQLAGEAEPEVWLARGRLKAERDGPAAAHAELAAAVAVHRDDADLWHALGWACDALDDLEGTVRAFRRVRELDAAADRAAGLVDPERLAAIERTAAATLHELPADLRDLLENVPIVLEARPARYLVEEGFDPRALGLFEGVEFSQGADLRPPDRIVLFYANLLAEFPDDAELADQVAVTILHEIGHYFGLDEDEVEALGLG